MTGIKIEKLLESKHSMLEYYRKRGIESMIEVDQAWSSNQYKKKASKINTSINSTRNTIVEAVKQYYGDKPYDTSEKLDKI